MDRIKFLILTALLLALSASRTLAGGGPAGYIVVYDPSDPRSVTIANEYQQVRGIPECNMIPYSFPSSFSRTTGWDFIYSLRATLAARGLDAQLQGIALAGVTPLSGVQTTSGAFSIHSFLYLSPNYSQASFPADAIVYQKAYSASSSAFQGPSPAGTVAMTATTDFSGQKYWPVSSIGFPGKSGNSTPEILRFIARAKAHDGARPTGGAIYWPLNTDVRSRTRESEIDDVKDIWQARGIRYVVASGAWVSDRPDIQGGVVGVADFTVSGDTFLPGAWVDHLTSFGGVLDTFNAGQTQLSDWLRAGADGSSGTMAEPYAIASKFPHAHIHTHLRAGASLAEAFWQSLYFPAEIICVGDPLLQPFAEFPVVTLTAPTAGANVSGNLAINATAAPTGGKTLEPDLDLFVDGRRIAVGLAGETVAVTRTVGGFSLNTATLSDGWHELRVVAYNNDSVRTQGEAVTPINVNNSGQSLALTGPATINPDGSGNFTVTPTGLGDLASLALQANGRTLAAVPTSGGTVSVSGALAPLTNQWSVYAVGTRSNGQQVWSAPFTTTVNWPAQAASTPVCGAAMADVRYFASTTNSGFDWDTATPDGVATFPGDVSNGLYITPTNVPGITPGNFSAKPGYELKLWLYAPTDDWYEIGFAFNNTYSLTRSCLLDGVALTERNFVFGPRRLAPGWHELRLRTAINNAAWTYWQVWLRGGRSQDFAGFAKTATASYGTGVPSNTPVIVSVTPSAAPVTGTTVKLTANATLNGGTNGITYNWSTLGGPKSVTFSPNNSTNKSTTVTFTQAGNYTIGLQAASATDSASVAVPVTVNATPSATLALSTGGITKALRGLPFDVYAYSKDQFGRRLEITGTNTNQPTVQWTTTDPAGSFTLVTTNGEMASFRSLSAVSAPQTVTITATGVNGRTGAATSGTITVNTNAPPMAGVPVFYVTQDATTGQLTLNSNISDPEAASVNADGSRTFPTLVPGYHWSLVGTPPGQTLTLGTDGSSSITAVASGPGTYTVQLDVIDQVGASVSRTDSFLVDSGGSLTSIPAPANVASYVGVMAWFTTDLPLDENSYQWQTSPDGGVTWQNLAGTSTVLEDYINFSLNYGPVTLADNGRQFRVVATNSAGTCAGLAGTLTVSEPTGSILEILPGGILSVPENGGNVTCTVSRKGLSSGTTSIDWMSYEVTNEGDIITLDSGTFTWADGDITDRILTVPIIDDALPEKSHFVCLNIADVTGGIAPNRYVTFKVIDNDNSGRAAFTGTSASVTENGGSISIPVHRSDCFVGPLTVNYSTQSGSAVAGQDFTATSGTLTWADGETADKTIVVPILSDQLVEGDETFTVKLTAPDTVPPLLGSPVTTSVTIKDAPYQQWQQTWWPAAVPAAPAFNDYLTGLHAYNPLFHFRFGELTGTNVFGVDSTDAIVVTGRLAYTGVGGSYALAQTGPRPSLWPGLETNNTALSFTPYSVYSVTNTPPRFSYGTIVNCGAASGLGSKLGSGFTISMFVKTTVTNCEMTLAGGRLTTASPANVYLSLNHAYNNATTCVPHTVRIFLAPQGASVGSLDYSVAFRNLPTGSMCDGQWHHLAVTVPAFTYDNNADYARFFFDGAESAALDVRGAETISSTTNFPDFSDTGFQIGANGSASPLFFFSGLLDEVAFIPRVLTPAEIAKLVAAGPPTPLPAYTADTANPSGDGIVNLMKYALGLNPLITTTTGLPTFSLQSSLFNYQFTRMRDASDISYCVETTHDLMSNSWTEVWLSATNAYPGTEPSVLETVPIDIGGSTNGFFRLRITRP